MIERKRLTSRSRILQTTQVINPNRRVYDYHTPPYLDTRPRRRSGHCPPDLAPQSAKAGLRMSLNQQAQSRLYGSSLGADSSASHGLAHQAVADLNIGSLSIDLAYLPRTVSIPESTNPSLDGGNLPTRAVSRSLSTLTI